MVEKRTKLKPPTSGIGWDLGGEVMKMAEEKRKQKKICPTCGDAGWIVPDDAKEPGRPDHVRCPTCHGDGFIEV